MSTTATNYLSKIYNLKDFPTPGVDNDSQGFRDQWANIHGAIDAVNDEVSFINAYAFKGDGDFDFYNNTLKNVELKNDSTTLFDHDLQLGDIVVDYVDGGYQTMTISAGSHNLNVINWPSTSAGRIIVAITPIDEILSTSVTFFDDKFVSLDSTSTYSILPGTNLFELLSEESVTKNNRLPKYYVKKLGYPVSISTSTWTEIESKYGNIKNRYAVGTKLDTIVSSDDGNFASSIALVPSIITSVMGPSSSEFITLASTEGILDGAKFYISSTSTIYSVKKVLNATTVEAFEFGPDDGDWPSGTITFINPRFDQQLLPLYLSTSSAMPTTSTSIAGEMRGQVYVDSSSTYIVYNDANNTGAVNKIQISSDRSGNPRWLGSATTATTADISNTSTVVATTEWVWNYVNSSTTEISATTAVFATSSTYANTATTMVPWANGSGVRYVSTDASRPPARPSEAGGGPWQDGDIWYQII